MCVLHAAFPFYQKKCSFKPVFVCFSHQERVSPKSKKQDCFPLVLLWLNRFLIRGATLREMRNLGDGEKGENKGEKGKNGKNGKKVPNSFTLNFFGKQKVSDPRLLCPKNFSPFGTWKTWNSRVALLSLTC